MSPVEVLSRSAEALLPPHKCGAPTLSAMTQTPAGLDSPGLAAYERYRGQILAAALPAWKEEVVQPRPGMIAEVVGFA